MAGRICLSCVLLLAPLLTGCPFESQVPLAAPGAGRLDLRLAGSWLAIDENDADTASVLVLPFNGTEWFVETRDSGSDVSRYRAVGFELGGAPFLQLNELAAEDEPGSFFFARYSFGEDGRLRIRFVGDKIIAEDLAEDGPRLAECISAHLTDPELDDPDVRLLLTRAK